MKTNGQVLDLWVDLEKEQYDWKKDVIVNKSKLLEKVEEAEKLNNMVQLKRNIFQLYQLLTILRATLRGW